MKLRNNFRKDNFKYLSSNTQTFKAHCMLSECSHITAAGIVLDPPRKHYIAHQRLILHFHISSWWEGGHPQKWAHLPSTMVLAQCWINHFHYFILEKWKKKSMMSNRISNCQFLTKRLKLNESFSKKVFSSISVVFAASSDSSRMRVVPTSNFAQGWGPMHTASSVCVLYQQRQPEAPTAFCKKKT